MFNIEMFDVAEFIMDTLKGMAGNYPDFQVKEYALNWYGNGKLTEEDLATVKSWFPVEESTEIPEEEVS